MEHHLVVVGPETKRGYQGPTTASHYAVLDPPMQDLLPSFNDGAIKRIHLLLVYLHSNVRIICQAKAESSINFWKNSNM